jgi:hypothetical protein
MQKGELTYEYYFYNSQQSILNAMIRFICAIPKKNMASPTLFRTWVPMKLASYNCTIIEGAWATSAEPMLFKAISIGDHIKEEFVGGGLRCNNPINHVLTEAESLFPSGWASCVVSLGTGQAKVIEMATSDSFQKSLPLNLIKVLKEIANDCEMVSGQIASRFTSLSKFYFRFNVDQGLQRVLLAEWKKMSDVKTHTNAYLKLHDVDGRLDQLIRVLENRPHVLSIAHLGKFCSCYVFHWILNKLEAKVTSPAVVPPKLKPVPAAFNRFTGQEDILHILMKRFFPNQCEAQTNIRFVLYGLGGIGKSQIVLKFLERAQK